MISLQADNRNLTKGTKYSYLTTNYSSAVTSFILTSSIGISVNDFAIVGEWGSETSEIITITSVTDSSNTIGFSATKFSHSESTKVTLIKYNKVRFFHTSDATFSGTDPAIKLGSATTQFDISDEGGDTFKYTWDGTGTDPDIDGALEIGSIVILNAQNFTSANNGTFTITGIGATYFEVTNASGVAELNKTIGTGYISCYIDIQADSFFTIAYDKDNDTGYGWFIFYNSYTGDATIQSNPIPYAGFSSNSVKRLLDIFFSTLNNKELKLIGNEEAFRWLNEGYSVAQNNLNLVNNNYTVASPYLISIIAGTAEYALPDDLGKIVSVYSTSTSGQNTDIPVVQIKDIAENENSSTNFVRYYLRGTYIGFSPEPADSATYYIYHTQKTTTLNSYYDDINLPNNNYYFLVDWMIMRAKEKLKDYQNSSIHKQLFDEGINTMKLTSHKQDNNPDSFGIDDSAIV